MKIEIEVSDIKTLFCALNNAIILYGDDVRAKFYRCESNYKLEAISYEEQDKRFKLIKRFYDDLYEKYKTEIDGE